MLSSLFARRKAAPTYPPFALQNANVEQWNLPNTQYEGTRNQAELYQRLTWVQIAVRTVAEAAATQALEIHRVTTGEDEIDIDNHPVELLLRKPNPLMSRFAFLVATYSYLRLTGNAYWWLNSTSENAPPDELWIIPSHQITPIPNGRLYLAGYTYDAGTGNPLTLPVSSVLHFKGWHPLSSFVGLSPVEALATDAEGDLAAQKWNRNYFAKNFAKPPGALTFSQMIPDAQWLKMQDEFRRQYGGTERNLLMLRGTGDSAVSYVQMAMAQKDMEFFIGRQFTKEEIFQLFGVPPGLLDKNVTEANATASKAMFSELTLWPLLTSVSEVITNRLLPLYGADLFAEFEDPRKADRMLELQEQEKYTQTHTIDEIRAKYYDDPGIGDERGKLLIAQIAITRIGVREQGTLGTEVTGQGAATSELLNAGQGAPGKEAAASKNPNDSPPSQDQEGQNAPQAKALLGELAAWRRKCQKRAKLADFEPDVLSDSVVAAVKALGADNWQDGFSWVTRYEALKAGKEPDRVWEDKLRAALEAELSGDLDEAVKAIAKQKSIDYAAWANGITAELLPMLTRAALDESVAQAAAIGIDFDMAVINEAALRWAHSYSFALIKDLTETTRKLVSKATEAFVSTPGMDNAQLRSLLEPAFGPVRAQMIATTEVTRAYAAGTQVYQAQLAARGVQMQRVWRTSTEGRVCPICAPNEDKPEVDWQPHDGPPAHVNCRCFCVLDVRP